MNRTILTTLSSGLLLIGGILSSGCSPDEGGTTPSAKPSKEITVYEAKKLDKTAYGMDSNNFLFLTASMDGEYVYAMDSGAKRIVAKKADSDAWSDPAQTAYYAATNETPVPIINQPNLWKTPNFSALYPSEKGFVSAVDGKFPLVFEGAGAGKTTALYLYGLQMNKPISAVAYAQRSDGNNFFYLAVNPPESRVQFRPYISPGNKVTTLWNTSLSQAPGQALNDIFTAFAQKDKDGDLYMASNNGIYKLKNADIGEKDKFLGEAEYSNDATEFSLDTVTANKTVNAMAIVGNYLLVGFKRDVNKDNGGVVVVDIVSGKKTSFGKGLHLTVNAITVLRHHNDLKGKTALVGTDKGMLMFKDGAFIEPVSGQGYLINNASFAHAPETTDYNKAVGGFTGDAFDALALDTKGIAEDKNGGIFIMLKGKKADDGGLYSFNIETKTVTQE